MPLLLGIDLGTSYFKVGLFDATGGLRGLGRVAVERDASVPERRELSTDTFWALLRRAFAQALTQAEASPANVAAVSYSSQASTFVLLDHANRPLTPLISWTDTRATPTREHLAFSRSAAFQRAVGFACVAPESAVTKWHWYKTHDPERWLAAQRILTISDYFTYALTGEPVGDASTAALLGIYHLGERRWWGEALEVFGVDARRLATPLIPGTPCGRTTADAVRLLGVPIGIPFAVGALDHHAAAIGSGLDVFADASISTGTVLAAICLADSVEPLAGCFHGPHVDGRRFYRLAFDPAGAGALEEFQRRVAPDRTIEQLIAEATAGRMNSQQAGAPLPTSPVSERGRAVWSLLERVALAQRGLVAAISPGRPPRAISATGGGARSRAWLGLMAETIGIPLVTPAGPERACLGAAVFAAAAAGIYPNIESAARAMVRSDRLIQPAARP